MSASAAEAAVRRQLADGLLGPVPEVDRREVLTEAVQAEAPLLATSEIGRTVERLLARVGGLGPLEPLLADGAVSEIMVNGPGPVWVERAGHLRAEDVQLDVAEIEAIIERIVAPLGLRADRSSPTADARLPDGSRVNVVLPPLAVDGPCVTIRKFRARQVPLGSFCTPGVAALLDWAVRGRANVLVSGATGAGKTTLLNALASAIAPCERVITIEDAAELRLPGSHVVRLEARPGNGEGVGSVSIRALLRNALRMRPDRLVIGEVRGVEALDMLQAMNTGHDGSLATCHANGPADALRRVETMALMDPANVPLAAVREQIDAAVDLVVHVARTADGLRQVTDVAEVSASPPRLRSLISDGRLASLPERAPRLSGAPLSPRWVGT